MKALVKTLDSACRINPTTNETLEAFRPSVVTVTEFVKTLGMQGKLVAIGGPLPDTATDDEFKKFFDDSDRDEDLAVDSFMAKMNQDRNEALDAESKKNFDETLHPSPETVAANSTGEDKPADAVTETAAPKAEEGTAAKPAKGSK